MTSIADIEQLLRQATEDYFNKKITQEEYLKLKVELREQAYYQINKDVGIV